MGVNDKRVSIAGFENIFWAKLSELLSMAEYMDDMGLGYVIVVEWHSSCRRGGKSRHTSHCRLRDGKKKLTPLKQRNRDEKSDEICCNWVWFGFGKSLYQRERGCSIALVY